METKVIPYVSGGPKGKKSSENPASSNIWQFLAKNERGSTFELPFYNKYDEEKTPGANNLNKKYITLN
jgi:hypothetical protein